MGRLENIIARNRRPNRPTERLVTSMVLGLIVLLIIALAVFTDWGRPPVPERPAVAPPADHSDNPRGEKTGTRVDGIRLWRAPVKPAAPR